MKRIEAVLSREKLQGMLGLKGKLGAGITRLLMKVLEIDKCNATQAKYPHDNAPDFAKHVLEDVGVRYEIPAGQLDRIPAEGGFITVSNHHFGSIDGLILCDTVGRKRKDYKLLTTFLLSLVPNLKEGFLPVDNLSGKQDARSVNSIRTALRHIADGGAIGFFPAGEVATYQKKGARTAVGEEPVIEDKPWANNIIKLIKKSGLPVIPIYFDGTNSRNFHWLGKIHRRLRTVRLIHELFNKEGTVVQVRIGQAIQPAEIARMDVESLGRYLRSRTYALEASCRKETHAKETDPSCVPIAPQEDPRLVREEMARIGDRVLFESGDYRCYLTPSTDIPHTMHELGRLRESIFRAVGEGSGHALDLDQYDGYYKHLILWHIPNGEIAGAYRIGFGKELMARPEGCLLYRLAFPLPGGLEALSGQGAGTGPDHHCAPIPAGCLHPQAPAFRHTFHRGQRRRGGIYPGARQHQQRFSAFLQELDIPLFLEALLPAGCRVSPEAQAPLPAGLSARQPRQPAGELSKPG